MCITMTHIYISIVIFLTASCPYMYLPDEGITSPCANVSVYSQFLLSRTGSIICITIVHIYISVYYLLPTIHIYLSRVHIYPSMSKSTNIWYMVYGPCLHVYGPYRHIYDLYLHELCSYLHLQCNYPPIYIFIHDLFVSSIHSYRLVSNVYL